MKRIGILICTVLMLFCLGSCQSLNNDSSTGDPNKGDSTQNGSGLEDGKDDGEEDNDVVITLDLGTLSTDSYVQIEKTSITVKSGESYTIVSPTCYGYEFIGWKDSNGDDFASEGTLTATENFTLTAIWQEDVESNRWYSGRV